MNSGGFLGFVRKEEAFLPLNFKLIYNLKNIVFGIFKINNLAASVGVQLAAPRDETLRTNQSAE